MFDHVYISARDETMDVRFQLVIQEKKKGASRLIAFCLESVGESARIASNIIRK